MSVRNNESFVSKSIDSVLNQTYKNFEFLIVDDFSNDNTYKIIKEYEKKDKRIKVFNNDKNLGLTKSLNNLISVSKGPIIARQDGDDISLKQRFLKQVHYFQSSKYEFSFSRAKALQGDRVMPKYSYYLPSTWVSKYKNPFIHGTLMIRKNTLKEVGNYNENFYYAQDYKLFKDLLDANKKFKYIREPLYMLNTENNISTLKKIEQNYYSDLVKQRKQPTKLIK